jgi:hypothetical protein
MRLKLALLLSLAPLGAASADSSSADLGALGADAGVSEKDMRMLMGAPTSYANYRTSYGQARWKLHKLEVAEREAAGEIGPVLAAKHTPRHLRRYAATSEPAPVRTVRHETVAPLPGERETPPPAETVPLPDD